MAKTESNISNNNLIFTDFLLWDAVSNKILSTEESMGTKGILVAFICNHCPYVHHQIEELVRIANDYRVQGVHTIALSSNDIEKYPEDAPHLMTEFAMKHKMSFPYFYDSTQAVAKYFDAACTPEYFLFNEHKKLVYHGQMDDSRPQNGIVVSGSDLRNAIDAILYNRKFNEDVKPSMGCSIKWK